MRRVRLAAGGGASPDLQPIGPCAERPRWLQVVNPTPHAIQVWIAVDGIGATRIDTVASNSVGSVMVFPGEDVRIGLTSAGPAGSYVCFLSLS